MPAGIIAGASGSIMGGMAAKKAAMAQQQIAMAQSQMMAAAYQQTNMLSGLQQASPNSLSQLLSLAGQQNAYTPPPEDKTWKHRRKAREIADAGRKLMKRIKFWARIARLVPLLGLIVDRMVLDLVLLVDECDREMALAGEA